MRAQRRPPARRAARAAQEEFLRKAKKGKLPEEATSALKAWWTAHLDFPYPSDVEKARLCAESGLDAQQVANWAVASGDHGKMPFLIIDKVRAKVFVFDATGVLRGATMVLLGKARGDDSPSGIGDRPLMAIRPNERITPAGRFVAALGHDFKQDVLLIDYSTAISLHRVVTGNPGDHRRERLATLSTRDKRISYGCINVPPQFYDGVVLQTFTGTSGIAYILPEVHKLEDVFPLAAGG